MFWPKVNITSSGIRPGAKKVQENYNDSVLELITSFQGLIAH
jgi:hypothetical protein